MITHLNIEDLLMNNDSNLYLKIPIIITLNLENSKPKPKQLAYNKTICEIYGVENDGDTILCSPKDGSPIIEFYGCKDEDGNKDTYWWSVYDHELVYNWCLDEPEQLSTPEKYKKFLEQMKIELNGTYEFYKKVCDYVLQMRNVKNLTEEVIKERFNPKNIDKFESWGFGLDD